ncbi:MAG: hypothetical protein E6K08_09580 [Methanobacteriota archaeon]|nr:MAG: hypothetical protein E6K08_09580 [Euryarchaeota archaeon]
MQRKRARIGLRSVSVLAAVAALVEVAFLAPAARAARSDITVAPWTFRTGSEASWVQVDGDWQLFLTKDVDTGVASAAGAHVNGVKGLSTAGLTIGFTVEGAGDYCSGGAPRFNLHLQGDPTTYFLGCPLGDRVGNVVSFAAGNGYGQGPGCETACQFPSHGTIDSLNIVFDEHGSTYLDDIFVGGFTAGGPGHTD